MNEGPNNFEQLLDRQAVTIRPEVQQRTEEGLFKTFESLRLVGQLFDIFVPKMVDVLVVAAGGNAMAQQPLAELPDTINKGAGSPPSPEGPKLPKDGLDEIR
ncbi:MAG: hypothetical protein RIC19_21775 [Phaeodactylibacter sp.]|uniref:hypothetical protein n=1 Tax=Phaeodactylibacter sp. TaxID=1940289 RepID=UPI0032EFEA85